MENSLESILSAVMSNEELMSKISDVVKGGGSDSISDVVSLISPIVSKDKERDTSKESESEKKDSNNEPFSDEGVKGGIGGSAFGKLGGAAGKSISNNKALLLALKPYLSKERGEIIEAMIRLSQIAEAVKLI